VSAGVSEEGGWARGLLWLPEKRTVRQVAWSFVREGEMVGDLREKAHHLLLVARWLGLSERDGTRRGVKTGAHDQGRRPRRSRGSAGRQEARLMRSVGASEVAESVNGETVEGWNYTGNVLVPGRTFVVATWDRGFLNRESRKGRCTGFVFFFFTFFGLVEATPPRLGRPGGAVEQNMF
jgi:hypothetical protein